MTITTPKIGELIFVRFGIGKQLARVEAITRGGRIKVRGYNASRGEWMKNLRTVLPQDVLEPVRKEIDAGKGWRVKMRDDAGEWIRDERGFVKCEWVPLPALSVEA
jgi:hypothetical protein